MRVCYNFTVPTERRIDKVTRVLSRRQPDLRVVLEGVTIAHNASAVIRTCDAAGVLYLDIISPTGEASLALNEAITTRADKWVEIFFHRATSKCLLSLKTKGYKIAVTCLGTEAVPYTEIDYTQPLALVFGNESEGISTEALALADYVIQIPMVGMVQSLNLSVSVGIILYEAFKQRQDKGFFDKMRLSPSKFEKVKTKWLGNK